MIRFTMLAVALLTLVGASSARGQDTDEVTRLKEKIELLQAKLETAALKIEKLEKELALTTKGGEKPVAAAKATPLSDILVAGAVLSNKSEHTAGPFRGATGKGTLTITSREGNSFKGTTTWVSDQDKSSGSGEIAGTISGNSATWKAVDNPVQNEVKGTLRADGSYIDAIGKNAKGTVIKVTLKVEKK